MSPEPDRRPRVSDEQVENDKSSAIHGFAMYALDLAEARLRITELEAALQEAATAIRFMGGVNGNGDWHHDNCPHEDGECSPECVSCRAALSRLGALQRGPK